MGLLTGQATAKKGSFIIDSSRTSEAHLRGTRGYVISLFADDSLVSLSAKGHHATVEYTAKGRVSKRLIKARFGRFGRVSVRFRPLQKRHLVPEPHGNCTGRGELVEPGVFVGTIRFVGEEGYTEVRADRAKGRITYRTKAVCEKTPDKESASLPFQATILRAGSEKGYTSFNAIKVSSSRRQLEAVVFGASVMEDLPHLLITRRIESSTDGGVFTTKRAHGRLVGAMVEPLAPFSGSATYVEKPDVPSEGWIGDLAGEFPGLGKVSLAGPGFCAESIVFADCDGALGLLAAAIG